MSDHPMGWILRLAGLRRDASRRANDLVARALMLELARTEEAALRTALLGTPAQTVTAGSVHFAVRCALVSHIRYGADPLALLRRVDGRTEDEIEALAPIVARVETEAGAEPRPQKGVRL